MLKNSTAKIISVAAACLCVSSASSAATFDFAKIADAFFWDTGTPVDGKRREASLAQAMSYGPTSGFFTDGGISLLGATATGTQAGLVAHAFLDANRNTGPAGLGVCSYGFFTNGVSRCSSNFGGETGDDNLTIGEKLTLNFDSSIAFDSLMVHDEKHKVIPTGTLSINGASFGIKDSFVQGLSGLESGSSFDFMTENGTPQLYLSVTTVSEATDNSPEAVPLPAGFALLAAALGGLGLMRRRKTKAA